MFPSVAECEEDRVKVPRAEAVKSDAHSARQVLK